jgi:hypothetical protein
MVGSGADHGTKAADEDEDADHAQKSPPFPA